MGKAIGKIVNWPEYGKALKSRYRVDLFIDKNLLSGWFHEGYCTGRGRSPTYSDEAILALLEIACTFKMPLRGAAGFLGSVMELAGVDLPVPDHTTISRRAAKLGYESCQAYQGAEGGAVMLVDSTGLKLAGEGEWKVRTHGVGKRREWVKLHLAIDPDTFEVTAWEVDESNSADGLAAIDLIEAAEPKPQLCVGDGAYAYANLRNAAAEMGSRVLSPPAKNARRGRHPDIDEAIEHSRKHGRAEWKKMAGYHVRSLVETQMGRWKKAFGPGVASKGKPGRRGGIAGRVAAMVGVINMWSRLGLPKRSQTHARRA